MSAPTVTWTGTATAGGATTNSGAVRCQYAAEAWFSIKNTGAAALGAGGVAIQQSTDGGVTFASLDTTNVGTAVNSAAANSLAAGAIARLGVTPKVATSTFGNVTHFRLAISGNAGASPANDTAVTVTLTANFDMRAPSGNE